ncbi:hypothetical protein [Ferroplasma acidarmanus]|uniref:Uncharacterized protein n=1 Tax=Ferroplasma acidarmanus Fer1 TaxID=333146 RepID=S0AP96_FERAC|nr:hypothetical protein [Ferroplasma acidarmanus]AGO60721.1 hypothetical protein FACI_IFERC00001G0741 [Ferroplasma acidarmanus Fer1]
MNKKKVIIGVLMAAIFVMLAFVPAADNMHTAQSNTATGNISPQVAISKYVVNKSQPTITTISNLSNKIAVSFSSWYMKNRVKENLPEISSTTGQSLFMQYINQSIAGKAYISQLTVNEKSSFNKSNKMEVSSIESILHSGHKVPSVIKNGSSITYIANVRADLPNGVTSDSGSWVMVTINYFIYHAPWWLGGWTWKYGQHDVINTLYGGNKAQTVFNGLYRHDGSTAAMLTTIFAAATGIAVETLGFSELVAAISLVVSLVLSNIKNVYLEMYESTYANKPSGNKYLWSYLSIDQYDKNNPVALASSIGWYGKLASGKTVTVIPNIPGLSSPVTLSFSMWADNIASSIGTDNWFMGDAP